MKKKKLRLKKSVIRFFIVFVILIVGVIYGLKYYNNYKYQQTNEYKLLQKGYSMEEIALLQNNLDEEEINNLLNEENKNEIYLNLFKEKYYLKKNLDEYLTYYQKNNEKSFKDIVAIVNTHANNKWYAIELDSKPELKELLIVNKFYKLKADYIPENLEVISLSYSYGNEGDNKLVKVAYDEFLNLWQAAHENGHDLMVTSSYRTYEEQKEIYDERKISQGERKADETAAHAGNSEHQSGYVVDMTSKNEPTDVEFSDSQAYKWLQENAYKYGFIERYPEGKTYLTGYSPESWHWRYVGKEAAKIVHDEDITYDEYYAYYIEK